MSKPEITVHNFVEVLKYLYLSDQKALANIDALKEQEIATVINCCSEEIEFESKEFQIINLDLEDTHDCDISEAINSTFETIAAAKESNKPVLITCTTGRSVSPALAIGYMMRSAKVCISTTLTSCRKF